MKSCLKCNKELVSYNKSGYCRKHKYLSIKVKAYRKTEKSKASISAYAKSDRGKASRAAYKKTDKGKAAQARYRKANLGKRNALNMKRKADILQRTPKWVDLKAIEQFYINCPKGYEVDHIIPLQGKNISGLHILENLQYLTESENCSKGNKF
jgi:hypothetical protein